MHLESSEQNLISHYDSGVLGVNGQDFHSNILITQSAIIEHWFSGSIDQLTLQNFDALFENDGTEQPEIVILGSGSKHIFPDFSLISALKQHGVAMEVMNTRAACRTYSVLVSEYRPVAAALFQLD
ncbi:MAG: Mth938-like domain-containing protein [Granulosicoccus sp.]